MFTRDGLRDFHRWTHERLDMLFDHTLRLPAEVSDREVPGFGHASIRRQMFHVIRNESVWVRALRELPLPSMDIANYRMLADLRPLKREVAAETLAYLDRTGDAELNCELDRVPPHWIGPVRTPAFILHHVLTHAWHHKGQMVAILRLLGHPAQDTDLQRAET